MCCVPLKVLQLQTSTAPPPTAPRIITSTSAPKTTAATKPELRSATVASITRAPAPAPAVTKVRDLAYTCGTSNVVHGAPTPAMRGEEAPLGNPETHGPQSSAFYSIGLHRLRRNDCFPTEIVDNLTRSYHTLFLDGCNYHFSFYTIYEKKKEVGPGWFFWATERLLRAVFHTSAAVSWLPINMWWLLPIVSIGAVNCNEIYHFFFHWRLCSFFIHLSSQGSWCASVSTTSVPITTERVRRTLTSR